MKKIFLGRPIHWLFVLILAAGGAILGEQRLHVIDFNIFILSLLAAVVILLALVVKTSGGTAPVTRDPIVVQETEKDATEV